jgi:hypothetical protein
MINEDGTAETRPVMSSKGRDGSVWRFNLITDGNGTRVNAASATRVASLNPAGRDGAAVGAGVWETSGILDTTDLFGADSWLVDVQAHSPTRPPFANTVEVGSSADASGAYGRDVSVGACSAPGFPPIQ